MATAQLTPTPTTDVGEAARPRRQPDPRRARDRRRPSRCSVVVAVNARTGAVAERITNPDVTGAPRPVEPLFGFDHWITLHQIGTVVMMVTLVDGVRDRLAPPPRPPGPADGARHRPLLVWQDPIMNWAPYAVYNPQLWHWPETWPLVSLSPTVEPFIVIGYATFYMAPFFPAVVDPAAPAGPPAGRVVRLAAPAASACRR